MISSIVAFGSLADVTCGQLKPNKPLSKVPIWGIAAIARIPIISCTLANAPLGADLRSIFHSTIASISQQ